MTTPLERDTADRARADALLEDEDGAPYPESVQHLYRWWIGKSVNEAPEVARKAVEYGAADLQIMGVALARLLPGDWTPEQCVELAIAFYELGKIARLFGAYSEGRMPSDDTWHDIGVYAKMVQRVREVGTWP